MHSIIFDGFRGGKFLDWTIFYLSGFESYYYEKSKKFIPVVDNPLTGINSHNHKSNHIEFAQEYDSLNKEHFLSENFSIIFHKLVNNKIQTSKEECLDKNISPKNLIKKIEVIPKNKIICLKSSKSEILYDNILDHRVFPEQSVQNFDNTFDFFVSMFGDSATKKFFKGDTSPKNIWDLREFFALNMNPFDKSKLLDSKDTQTDYFPILSTDLMTVFDLTVYKLFDFLERPIVEERYKKWIKVYYEWKKYHIQPLRFCWYFDEIIESILVGRDINLMQFELTFEQESIIQHVLIHKHGLNLKTWKLYKFKNTRQLHNLLEPNFHF